MAKKRRRADSDEDLFSAPRSPTDVWHSVVLAAFVALLVARTFVPEDGGGQLGHGAPFAVLWLTLAGAWLVGRFRHGAVRLRFEWPDALVAALITWHTLAALIAIQTGHPRPAMNMLCDWLAMGLVYVLARQILAVARDARAAVVVMLGLACGMTAVAIHQYFVTLPRDIAAFEAARHSTQELFQETGQWLPPGSGMFEQFEARLKSRLPAATFALSNSMAGFLVAWGVVLVGLLFELHGRAVRIATLGIAAAFAFAIWLAGSRSAALAALVGVGLVMIDRAFAHKNPVPSLRRAIVVAGLAIIALIAALLLMPFSKTVMATAWRSVAFRLEYWRSTLAMIADYPLFGCGPGQFQDTYTRYKLVGAAEEIHDPHNWLFEMWATAGTPAAILFFAILVVITLRALRTSTSTLSDNDNLPVESTSDSAVFGGVAGVVLGTVLAWLTGYPLMQMHVILFVAGIVGAWFLWHRWMSDGTLPPRLPLIAAIALLVNLLAAGGIGYPSVADSLWLLLALQVNGGVSPATVSAAESAGGTRSVPATMARWCIGLVLVMLIVLAIKLEYAPVMACRTHLAAADEALAAGRGDVSRAAFEAAVAADPWSALAAARLADQRFADYQAVKSPTRQRELEAADARARELAPRRSKTWAQSAEFAATIFHDTQDVEYRTAAERYLQRATDLYPTSAEVRAQAAGFWASLGERARARAEAREALRLDDAMRAAGHVDRILRAAERRQVEAIASDN